LRALDHPLRIGDVLVLPITGFSPGGEKDFGAEGYDSPQANVIHNCESWTLSNDQVLIVVRGSWKGDGQKKK
jgi:alpha 1,6-mannosyltransferase